MNRSVGHYSRPDLLPLQVNTDEQVVMNPLIDRFSAVAEPLDLYPVMIPKL